MPSESLGAGQRYQLHRTELIAMLWKMTKSFLRRREKRATQLQSRGQISWVAIFRLADSISVTFANKLRKRRVPTFKQCPREARGQMRKISGKVEDQAQLLQLVDPGTQVNGARDALLGCWL